jgi:hypothetical protein
MSIAAPAVALFWLVLALPGYALLRRYARPWLEAGPLAGFTLSCLATFVLLTPVSVAGYALRWPLWVLTASVCSAVIAAALHLARDASWRALRARPSLVAVVAASIVVGDALMGLFQGSYLYGDGVYHVGRVRMLLEHGFNDLDPMIEGQLERIYHGNLYHALIAVSAQLVDLSAAHAWAYALFWAKLATAGGVYYLAWIALRERALAWAAAAMFAVYMAPLTVRVYPNSLCIYGLVPLALACAIQVLIGEDRLRAAAGLGAAVLVTAQVHVLYYVFLGMLIGPALLVALLRTRVQRLPGGRELTAALLALLLGLPWVATTVAQRAVGRSQPPQPPPSAQLAFADQRAELGAGEGLAVAMIPDDVERAPTFLHLPSGQIMLNPSRLGSPYGAEPQLLLALGVGFFTRRRRAVLAIGAPLLVLLVSLYVPPLCTALADFAGAPWIVRRLSVAFHAFWFAVVPGTLLSFIGERWPTRWLEPLALALGVAYGHAQGVDSKPWTRASYFSAIDRGARRNLQRHASRRALFDSAIPRGATVLSQLADSPFLTMDCDCYPLAITEGRGSRGVGDMPHRRSAARFLLHRGPELDLRWRLQVLRHYGVTAMWLRRREGRALAKIYRPLVASEHTSGRYVVLVLDLNRALPPPAGG